MAEEPRRRPQNSVQLAKSSTLWRLRVAVVDAHNRTSIAELSDIRRALTYLVNDWDDQFGHGYVTAIHEVLRNTERNQDRRRLWVGILSRALNMAQYTEMGLLGICEQGIDEHIADLGRLS